MHNESLVTRLGGSVTRRRGRLGAAPFVVVDVSIILSLPVFLGLLHWFVGRAVYYPFELVDSMENAPGCPTSTPLKPEASVAIRILFIICLPE